MKCNFLNYFLPYKHAKRKVFQFLFIIRAKTIYEWTRFCETHFCFKFAVQMREKGWQFQNKHAFHRNESALILSWLQFQIKSWVILDPIILLYQKMPKRATNSCKLQNEIPKGCKNFSRIFIDMNATKVCDIRQKLTI